MSVKFLSLISIHLDLEEMKATPSVYRAYRVVDETSDHYRVTEATRPSKDAITEVITKEEIEKIERSTMDNQPEVSMIVAGEPTDTHKDLLVNEMLKYLDSILDKAKSRVSTIGRKEWE